VAEVVVNNAPAAEVVAVDPGKTFGMVSMIAGIAGLVLGTVLSCACACLGSIIPAIASVVAIVLGIMAMNKSKAAGYTNKMALAGIILGAVALVVILVFIIVNAVIGAGMGMQGYL
jgi:hypothetical protein